MVSDCTGIQEKKNIYLTEDKKVYEAINERTSIRIKVYSIWIKNNMRKDILNYYYSMGNGTWLCDKARIYQ